MPWQVEVLNEAVAAELEALDADLRAKLDRVVQLLATLGPGLVREPYVKHLDGKLWEMRVKRKSQKLPRVLSRRPPGVRRRLVCYDDPLVEAPHQARADRARFPENGRGLAATPEEFKVRLAWHRRRESQGHPRGRGSGPNYLNVC